MTWNWQLENWPHFDYDKSALLDLEGKFMYQSGVLLGTYKHLSDEDKDTFIIDQMTQEALKTSEIEGEHLDRERLHDSIQRNFGLEEDALNSQKRILPAEQGIADLMMDLFCTFATPLTHDILFNWHTMLTKGRRDLFDIGQYRTHTEPMQVFSGNINAAKVQFEAPPSASVTSEMDQFIEWFNKTAPEGKEPMSALARAGMAHLYFVCIHPFEDGNGRIGRAIVDKALAQSLGHPTLIALSHTIQAHRKIYYDMLEHNNKTIQITDWLIYFTKMVLEAQEHALNLIDLRIEKTKISDKMRGELNPRQEKVIALLFKDPRAFEGGLDAENYINITGTSRATATRDLQDLVKKEVLSRTGVLKGTRYCISRGHTHP